MKHLALLLLFLPFFALGTSYSDQDIVSIELEMNHSKHAYDIVYVMNDGAELTSNLTAAARTEFRAMTRLYQVTSNTPGFENITQDQIEILFDWNSFVLRREMMKSLINSILEQLDPLAQSELYLALLVIRESY